MTGRTGVAALLMAAGLATGCSKEPAVASRSGPAAPAASGSPSTEDYVYARKAEYVARMKADLQLMEAELNRMAAKVDGLQDADKRQARVDALRGRWAKAKHELELAEDATSETWDGVKTGFRQSYGELKDSVDETREWMSEKIAP